MYELACIVGARPNFIKIAPILGALRERADVRATLIHTGQHYDAALSDVFFTELGIPRPEINLNVGSGRHGAQTARILKKFEDVLIGGAPSGRPFQRVVVVGDVNSTIACALAASKLGIPVAHVEAGLRSFDRTMPEEINRILTDAISDCLLVSEPAGLENLRREGHSEAECHLVGNVMVDTLLRHVELARTRPILGEYGLRTRTYGVVTLHRPGNVDDRETFAGLLGTLCEAAREIPLVFPVHPRTRGRIKEFGLGGLVESAPGLKLVEPLGYLDCLCLTSQAKAIVTDSGGLQEESTALGVPCLTCRPNTERPITVTEGTSVLVGSDPEKLRASLGQVLSGTYKTGRCPELWDGRAAERIAAVLTQLGA